MSDFVFFTNLDKNLINITSTILAKIKEHIIKNTKYRAGLSDK